ncbi:MAG: DUF1467 family protein [Pseudomonadota bacterium]|nr:DUF1467 family protein [Pseudomonadota bacterium]MDE3038161.1 DUF1467 family protein [Pseudomonadota bacterium]
MSPLMAVFTFIVSWWIMLFFVLPLDIETLEKPGSVEYAAAPKSVNWLKKLLLTTILALAVTGLLALVIHSGLIRLRDY